MKAALSAHIASLNALRDTQNDHHAEMKREFAAMRGETTHELTAVRAETREGFGKLTELLAVAIKKGGTDS